MQKFNYYKQANERNKMSAIRADHRMMEIDTTIASLTNTLTNSKNRQTETDLESKLMLLKLKREKLEALSAVARTQALLAELDLLVAAKELKLEVQELITKLSKNRNSGRRNSSTKTSSKKSSDSDKTQNSPSKKLQKEIGTKSPLHTLNRHSTKITKRTTTKNSYSKTRSTSNKNQESQEIIGSNEQKSKDKISPTESVKGMHKTLFSGQEQSKKSKSTDVRNKGVYRNQEVTRDHQFNTKEDESQDIIDAIRKHQNEIRNTQESVNTGKQNQRNAAEKPICGVFDSPKTTRNNQLQYNKVETTRKFVNRNTPLTVKINRTSLHKPTNDRLDNLENNYKHPSQNENNNQRVKNYEHSKEHKNHNTRQAAHTCERITNYEQKTHYEKPNEQNKMFKQNNVNSEREQEYTDQRYSTVRYLEQVNRVLTEQNKPSGLHFQPPKHTHNENRNISDSNDINSRVYNEILRGKTIKKERSTSLSSVDTAIVCLKCGYVDKDHVCPCP